MSGLVLRWRVPAPQIVTRWRGPAGALEAVAAQSVPSLAGFIVPPANVTVTGGDGIAVVGSDIRVTIDELPSA